MDEYFHGNPREFIIIERPVAGRNTFGQRNKNTYEIFAECKAWIIPLTGREFFTAQGLHSTRAAVLRIRFCPGIDETMRVKWRGAVYAIRGITPILPNKGFDLAVEIIK